MTRKIIRNLMNEAPASLQAAAGEAIADTAAATDQLMRDGKPAQANRVLSTGIEAATALEIYGQELA